MKFRLMNFERTMKKIVKLLGIIFVFMLVGCGNMEKTTEDERTVEVAEDTEQNEYQRRTLFNHIGLSMEQYELVEGITTNGSLSQWWYKDSDEGNTSIYIAIGDINANDGKGFPEIGDEIKTLSKRDDFILEITIGSTTDDGFLDVESEMRSYYFVQQGKEIAFVSLVLN